MNRGRVEESRMMSAVAAESFPRGIYASPFRPAWWLRNPHAQTLFSNFFRRPPQLPRTRETLTLPDGDFLDLDWHLPAERPPQGPLVLVVHGLSGSSESHYVLGLQAALAQHGWGSVAMNCRGASGRPNNLPRAYHAGGSDDLQRVLAHMRQHHAAAPLAVVGYSLGGSMTLNLMGQTGDVAPVFAAVAVSVPLLLPVCADRMDRGFSRIYRQHFMAELTAQWEEKMRHLERRGDMASAARVRERLGRGPFRSFWHFDNDLIAPLHGFRDVHDYYRRASPRQFLARIRRPTLVIQSRDDPFMTPGVLPDAGELSPAVHFELCREGGHVGFIEGGTPRAPRYYLEHRIPAFLQAAGEAIQGPGELLG
jgi:predicted alpha/beta-fold hydrolase